LPNEWVNIPVESLEQDYIISLDATVEIRHDQPEIHLISGVDITEITSNPIQIGQNTDIYAQLLDTDGQSYDLTDGTGQTVYFYEVLNPILYNLIAEPSIIQTSETTDITVQMKDSDGSKIGAGETVYFYAVEGAEPVPPTPTPVPTNLTLTSDKDILSHYDSDSAVLSATVKDQNGEVMSGQSVVFKKGSVVLATKTTDSGGVASYTYASQGVGDVTLTVECMNLQETYELEDCNFYSSDGTKLQGTYTTGNDGTYSYITNIQDNVQLPSMTFPSNFVFSMKHYAGGTDSWGNALWLIGSDSQNGLLIGAERSNTRLRIYNWSNGNASVQQTMNSSYSASTWYTLEIECNNGVWTVKANGNTISYSKSFATSIIKAYSEERYARLSEIKIKPL